MGIEVPGRAGSGLVVDWFGWMDRATPRKAVMPAKSFRSENVIHSLHRRDMRLTNFHSVAVAGGLSC